MAIDVTIPQLGKVKKTNKDLVISALKYDYPLTLIKLTNAIKKKYHVSVTFQGVRKAVNQLVENGVVVKISKEYSLSKDWILRLRDFVEDLHETYFTENTRIKEIEAIGGDIRVYTFDNLIDADVFWNNIIGKWFDEGKTKKDKYYVQQSGHTWYVLANLEEETKILEKIQKNKIKFYTLAIGNSVLDKWSRKYYKKQGFFYTTSKNKKDTSKYFAVYGDRIIQCDYPTRLTNEIDKIYQKAKDFESLDVTGLIKILRKKTELKILVMRNPVVAEQLRNLVLSNFKIKK